MKINKFWKIIFYILLSLFFLASLTFCLFHFGLLNNFIDLKFDKSKLSYTSAQVKMYDNKNNLILSNNNQVKDLVSSEIPQELIEAFISIEDKDFYKHKGINYKRIIAAMIKNIKTGTLKEGASTISQQLIKNTHLTNEKTFSRKIKELILTKKMESELSKEEIITAYLNAIYFGNGAFGINQASQRYFSKEPKDLNLSEIATLAGIIKSPLTYSPLSNINNCIKRRNLVLKEMLKEKKINKEEYDKTVNQPIVLNINKNFLGNNTYYSAVIDEACNILKISEKDLFLKDYKIYTYKDDLLQNIVEEEINKTELYTNNFACDSMSMILDNKTGGVLAFSGKSDFNLLNLYRQPGSTFKPIISYAPALENNVITTLTPILDEKIVIDNYSPKNYNNKYNGWISVKESLAKSLNIPSVKILNYTGIEKAKTFAKNLNIIFDEKDNGYSLALGGLTKGIKIKDLINSYQAFANNGKYIKSNFIKEIQTNTGKTIYKNNEIGKQVMKESTSFLITDMLKNCVTNGTSRKLNLNKYYIAAKTGTVGVNNSKNKENSDAWSVSYTPDITLGVWVGTTNNNYLPKNITGAATPSNIAQNIYQKSNFPKNDFKIPNNISECEINEIEYQNNKLLLASENTPDRYKVKGYFANDNLPKSTSNMFDEINDVNFDVKKINENSVEICFEAFKHLKYKLIRESEDTKIVIAEIQDKQGEINIKDCNLLNGNIYTYYIETKYSNVIPNLQHSNSNISNKTKIFMA